MQGLDRPALLWLLLAVGVVAVASAVLFSSGAGLRARFKEEGYDSVEAAVLEETALQHRRRLALLEAVERVRLETRRAETAVLAEWAVPGEEARRNWLEDRFRGAQEAALQRARVLAEAWSAEVRDAWRRTMAEAAPATAEGAAAAARPVLVLGAVVIAGGVLVLALAALESRRRLFTRPLVRLAGTMQRVAAGSEDRMGPAGSREVRTTVRAFNRMVDALSSMRRELRSQVDAKTAALAQALEEQRNLNERQERLLEELQAAQEQLLRQQKMAALGTLAGGVAHEFNNVLGGIRGCSQEALEEVDQPGARESLEIIQRAAERGRRIVDGLMRFSQAAHRRPVVLDLAEVLEETLGLLAPEAERGGVTLRSRITGSLAVQADPVEIHQVMHNLLLNAVQVSGPGQEVTVTGEEAGGCVRIQVLDRGPGIPPGTASRVFEPFFTTREQEGGTGLGLAISHGIVESLGGTLAFAPRSGGGTVFTVELPLAERGDHARDT